MTNEKTIRAEGMIEGLGMAIILAHKYRKNPSRLLRALSRVTQRIQLDGALDRLLMDIEVERNLPALRDLA